MSNTVEKGRDGRDEKKKGKTRKGKTRKRGKRMLSYIYKHLITRRWEGEGGHSNTEILESSSGAGIEKRWRKGGLSGRDREYGC